MGICIWYMYITYLGKLQYFTNLTSSAIWGWFSLLTMISSEGEQWGRYNLPVYIYMFICTCVYDMYVLKEYVYTYQHVSMFIIPSS